MLDILKAKQNQKSPKPSCFQMFMNTDCLNVIKIAGTIQR